MFALLSLAASGTYALRAEDLNNGQDFTNPPPVYDFRYQFMDKGGGVEQSTFTLRLDKPFQISENWKLATRFDLPLVLNNETGSDNPNGRTRSGVGDLLAQAVLIETVSDRFAYGAGVRMVFPAANEDEFGSGKYQVVPLAGARYKLPEISRGSFLELVLRYDFDAAGDGGRNHVSKLRFSPTLSVALPERWFVTLFPSQDIVLNTIGGNKWFVPADFSVGRNITERIVTSLEISVPIVKQFTLYDFKLEARLSYSF
jgi:hypothetical protein